MRYNSHDNHKIHYRVVIEPRMDEGWARIERERARHEAWLLAREYISQRSYNDLNRPRFVISVKEWTEPGDGDWLWSRGERRNDEFNIMVRYYPVADDLYIHTIYKDELVDVKRTLAQLWLYTLSKTWQALKRRWL